jgi:hypothetical protein
MPARPLVDLLRPIPEDHPRGMAAGSLPCVKLIRMTITHLLPLIDAEIVVLKRARALLTTTEVETVEPRRGRPKGSKNAPAKKKKRNMSPEGRARIVAAVTKRWATQKKAAKA